MTANLQGRLRGYLSTVRAGLSLMHWNMARIALTSPKKDLRAYADATFKLYLESYCKKIEFLELTDALDRMGMERENIQVRLIDVGGYRGRPDWERVLISSAVRHYGDYPCFEIGTAAGNTTVLIAHNTESPVYTLDLADSASEEPSLFRLGSDDAVRAARKRAEFVERYPRENIVQLIGDSATFDYSNYREKIGLFFVDGAHSFEYVQSDTFNAAFCCRLDGLIIWDDFTTSRDVTNYVRSLKRLGVDVFGVKGTKLALSQDIEKIREISGIRAQSTDNGRLLQ